MAARTARGLVLGLAVGCGSPAPAPVEPTTWDVELAALSADIDASTRHAKADPTDWLRRERLALLHLDRAQRTGDLADYQAAERELSSAFDTAADGSGPVLAQATVDLALHRFAEARERAQTVLDRPLTDDRTRANALHVDVLARIELADLEGATAQADAALTLDPSPRAWADKALVHQALGNEGAWSRSLDEAALACACPNTRFASWVAWQRGLHHLEADEPDRALAWFTAADGHYPGDWVIEEHRAEALVLTGKADQAVDIYEAILAERDAPVVWWGLAKARAALGQPASSALIRAEQGFDARLEVYPDAMAGHALEFFAEHGSAERVDALTRRDAALRPSPTDLEIP